MTNTNKDILDRIPQLLSATAGVNAALAPLDACIMGFTGFKELDRADFPHVTYWNEGDFKGVIVDLDFEPGTKGGTRRAKGENVNAPYIEGLDGKPVHGSRLTSIGKYLRGSWHELAAAGMLKSGSWELVAPSAKVRVFILMWTNCPELQLCYGNWKTDYLCRAAFSGWFGNHGYKYLQPEQQKIKLPKKKAALSASSTGTTTPSATGTDPSATITPSAASTTSSESSISTPDSAPSTTNLSEPTTTPSGFSKRTRDDNVPDFPDSGTSTDMDSQDQTRDPIPPPAKRVKNTPVPRPRPQVQLFGSEIEITGPINLEPNQASSVSSDSLPLPMPQTPLGIDHGVSSAPSLTVPTPTVDTHPVPLGSGNLLTQPASHPLPAAPLESREHPAPATTGSVSSTQVQPGPAIQNAAQVASSIPPAVISQAPEEPPTIAADKQVMEKAGTQSKLARRPPKPKAGKLDEPLKITGDANTAINLAKAAYISQKPDATKGEFYAWSKGLPLSEWQAFGDRSQ
ncbi:hypothetical protein PQX77_011260 [Marasmius sp. AFHP31]|nr:hypothetical protein PQX77_011260 [Marasmius sp. AFHP31]